MLTITFQAFRAPQDRTAMLKKLQSERNSMLAALDRLNDERVIKLFTWSAEVQALYAATRAIENSILDLDLLKCTWSGHEPILANQFKALEVCAVRIENLVATHAYPELVAG